MYAPPSHAPPAGSHGGEAPAGGSSSSSSNTGHGGGGNGQPYSNPYGPWPYAPTTQPTPGQALLNNGKMLVYPHDWPGCPKCQNTGYKYGDPSNPCRGCWNKYGQKPNAILIASAGMRGAKVLQRPLHAAGMTRPSMPPMSSSMGAYDHGYMAPQQTGTTGFAPPMHPPPLQQHHRPHQPPARPAVRRENNEEDLNEEGEAPPAYEDAVAAGPDGALPPQRRQEGQQAGPSRQEDTPASMMANMSVGPTPVSNMSVMLPTSPGGHIQHPPWAQQNPWQSPQPFGGPPWANPGGQNMHMSLPFAILPGGAMPPPNAIPVAPGDPRIGGQLCYKCGGTGLRETLWLSQETCNRCNGIGRLLI